jgi:hypothetical protein
MRVQLHTRKIKICMFLYMLAVLVLTWSVTATAHLPAEDPAVSPRPADPTPDVVDVIVQGAPGADLDAPVEAVGGQVTRRLDVIDAVAARVPEDRLEALRQAPGVRRVWRDAVVQADQTADSSVTYAPVDGGEVPNARFVLKWVVTYDGKRETLDSVGKGTIDPSQYMSFTFAPTVDPSSTPGGVYLNLTFFEQGLGKAQVQVHQASSGAWPGCASACARCITGGTGTAAPSWDAVPLRRAGC